MNHLLSSLESRHTEIVSEINEIVDVETSSFDLEQLSLGVDKVKEIAFRNLGTPSAEELLQSPDYGDTLILTYEGTSTEHVLLVAHYDTVWPTGTLETWPHREALDDSGRKTLTGPGIFDMKTGLVQAIWAAKSVREADAQFPTISLLFNGDEELGSPFSRPIIEKQAALADAVIVLEPSSNGAMKTGRKGVGIIDVTAEGIESHAGLDPYKGASAVKALMEFCLASTQLADREKGTTVNIGLVSGGTGSNVIAGRAQATIDVRVLDPKEFERIDQGLDQITWSDNRVSITTRRDWNRPPMVPHEGSQELFKEFVAAAESMERTLTETTAGGGSDANYVSAMGIPVICGAGAVGDGAHARHEFIYPDEIPFRTALVAQVIQEIARSEKYADFRA